MPLLPRPPVPFVRVNGHELSRTSVNLRVGPLPIVGWTALNFESVRAPGMSHGSRAKPQARTRGKVTFPADLTVYERDWYQIRLMLIGIGGAQGNLGWMEAAVPIVLSYFEPSSGPGVQVVSLLGCQVISSKQAIGDSDDELSRNLTLSVMDILEDGVSGTRENVSF